MQYDLCLKCTDLSALIAALSPYGLTTPDESGATVLSTAAHDHALSYVGRVVSVPAEFDVEGNLISEATYYPGEYVALHAEEALLRQIVAASLDGVAVVDPVPGISWGGEWRPLPAGPTLFDVQAAKLAEIRAACDAALNPLAASYPDREVQSWPQQVAEATALEGDANAAAPLIRQMAAMRSSLGDTQEVRVVELARRIRQNAADWSAVAGPIIGKRQALEDAVAAAGSTADVAAIVIDFGVTA